MNETDWLMIRRAPASRAAAASTGVVSRRSRLVPWSACSYWRGSMAAGRSVSWLTSTSGRAAMTAARTPSLSNASQTTASTPAARSASAFSGDRVMAVTSWPACSSRGAAAGRSRRWRP